MLPFFFAPRQSALPAANQLFLCLLAVVVLTAGCSTVTKKPETGIKQTTFNHITGRLIYCGDANIYVEEMGNPEAPVLVLLHGAFGNIEDFNTITPVLKHQFHLIGIDSRGHGRSHLGTMPLSYALLTEDLAQIIKALGLKKFSILGISDGGTVAYRYAARKDPRLQKLITIGSRWKMTEYDPAWAMISGLTSETWKEMFPETYDRYMALNPKPAYDHFAKAVFGMWKDLGETGYPGTLVQHLNTEMLIVRGDDDPLTSLVDMAALHRIIPKSHFLNIPYTGQDLFADNPALFLQVLSTFLDVPLSTSFLSQEK